MYSGVNGHILVALEGAQLWLCSKPEPDAEDIKRKRKEIEASCDPIVSCADLVRVLGVFAERAFALAPGGDCRGLWELERGVRVFGTQLAQ